MILVDTDLIIDYLRGDEKSISFIENNEISITYLTKLELFAGCSNKSEIKILDENIDFDILSINDKILEKSLKIYKNHHLKDGIGIIDSIISATAIENNIDFCSKNFKHYKNIEKLKLIKY